MASGGIPGLIPAAFAGTFVVLTTGTAIAGKKSVCGLDITLPDGVTQNDLAYVAIVPIGTTLSTIAPKDIREIAVAPGAEFGGFLRLHPLNITNCILAVGSKRGLLRFVGDQNDQT